MCLGINLMTNFFFSFSRCRYWHRSIGALSVWLSWLSLVLFMRKFPKLGIYVVMFTDILKTFAQFFLVFCLFIIAFGLGFHMLLFEQVILLISVLNLAYLATHCDTFGLDWKCIEPISHEKYP